MTSIYETSIDEQWAKRVLVKALAVGRAAELLDRLFAGASVTIDAGTGDLAFASAEQLAAMWAPGACPGAAEGNGRPVDGVVVADEPEEDHAAPGGVPGSTLSVGRLVRELSRLPWSMPVRLMVLGDVIDVAGVEVGGEVLLVGAEVVE